MKRQIIFWTIGIILFGAAVFALGRLSNGGSVSQNPPEYSLSTGSTGMLVSSGTTYVYDTTAIVDRPKEELVAKVQQYLERLDNSDLECNVL